MCNLERAKVTLPEGYSWSKEESIDNTDCSSNKQFGGEVNTPPLHLCCLKELHDLRSVYESMVAAGGRLNGASTPMCTFMPVIYLLIR